MLSTTRCGGKPPQKKSASKAIIELAKAVLSSTESWGVAERTLLRKLHNHPLFWFLFWFAFCFLREKSSFAESWYFQDLETLCIG